MARVWVSGHCFQIVLQNSDDLQRPPREKGAGRLLDIASVSVPHGATVCTLGFLTKIGFEGGAHGEKNG